MDKYDQLKQFLINTDNGKLVKEFEASLKEQELDLVRDFIHFEVEGCVDITLLSKIKTLLYVKHPLDEVIDWAESLDRYSHINGKCIVSHFSEGTNSTAQKFAEKFNISEYDALSLWSGHFDDINPKFENYNNTLTSD